MENQQRNGGYLGALRRALRPEALVVVVVSVAVGVTLAYRDGFGNPWAVVLLAAGVLLVQLTTGLMAEYGATRAGVARGVLRKRRAETSLLVSIFAGIVLLVPIVLFFLGSLGWPAVVFVLAAALVGYFYAAGPRGYRILGLGVVASFFLGGIGLVQGSYYALSGSASLRVLWQALPVSFLCAHVVLAAEIRDHEADALGGVPALTQRIGFANGVRLYYLLLILAYIGAGALFLFDLFPHPYFIPFALFLLIRPTRILLRMAGSNRRKIVSAMLLHHAAFGVLYLLTFIIPFGA